MNFLTPASVRSSSGPSGGGGPSGVSVVVVSLIDVSGSALRSACKAGAEDGLRSRKLKEGRQIDPLSSQIVPDLTARRSESRSVFRAMTWEAPAPAAKSSLAAVISISSAARRFITAKACDHWDLAAARGTSD